jgi:dTDP-4-dehydrorhamnose reductase
MDAKTAIIGIDSMIGGNLFSYLKTKKMNCFGTSRRSIHGPLFLDLNEEPSQWPSFPELKTLVICASLNNIDECQKKEDLSYKINVKAAESLAKKYWSKKTQLIFFSSSHVFDGVKGFYTESDATSPANVYGQHKTLTEKMILDLNGLVIRLTKVIDDKSARFNDWAKKLRTGSTITCRDDLNASLIQIPDINDLLLKCIKADKRGIIHFSGPEDRTYYEIGKLLSRNIGVDPDLVQSERIKYAIQNSKIKQTTLKNSTFVKESNIANPDTEVVIRNWCKNYLSSESSQRY